MKPQETDLTTFPTNPVDIFELFFDSDVIDHIVNETQRYASSKGNDNFQTNPSEIKTFLAILLVSGYHPVPRRRMYWCSENDVHNDLIASAMSRNRFEELMIFIHFADNDSLDLEDKMGKVRPLFNMLNEKFLLYFQVIKSQDLSIDEPMVPYFCRHGAKQFIRGKPIRFGFKLWCLATPLGYLVQMEPYQGAKG